MLNVMMNMIDSILEIANGLNKRSSHCHKIYGQKVREALFKTIAISFCVKFPICSVILIHNKF